MKFSLYSLAFLASTCNAFETEVERIQGKIVKGTRKALKGKCNHELDASMLIAKVSFIRNRNYSGFSIYPSIFLSSPPSILFNDLQIKVWHEYQ